MGIRKQLVIGFSVMFLVLTLGVGGVTWYFVDVAMRSAGRIVTRGGFTAPIDVSAIIWAIVLIVLATFLAVGGFIWYARRAMSGDRKLLAGGLPGTARVLAVRDTGTTINRVNAVVELRLLVSLPGRADYEAVAEILLGRMQWGALQPGMVVGVRVDPADPRRVAIDRATPVAGAPGAQATAPQGSLATPGGFFAVPGVAGNLRADKVRSAADVVAKGVKAEATILGLSDTGATAGQMAPQAKLDPAIADDPMIYLSLQVEPRDGAAPFASQGVHRVPRSRLGKLAIGKRIPVAYLPGNTASATIDWTRLR